MIIYDIVLVKLNIYLNLINYLSPDIYIYSNIMFNVYNFR